jgi:predicted 2-oxoglutarate/Fe(II)-dependent dioxygenase YbiX
MAAASPSPSPPAKRIKVADVLEHAAALSPDSWERFAAVVRRVNNATGSDLGDIAECQHGAFESYSTRRIDPPFLQELRAIANDDMEEVTYDHLQMPWTIPVPPEDELLKECTPSGYGDVATASTKFDPDVRLAFESRTHALLRPVEEIMTPAVMDLARKVFRVETVVARGHKLCVYPVGGHFRQHKDTPPAESTYLGTMVVELPTDRDGGDLVIADDTAPRACNGTAVVSVFRPYVNHSVTRVERGMRVSLTYELFTHLLDVMPTPGAEHGDASRDGDKAARAIRAYMEEYDEGIGLLLEHKYAMHQKTSGGDLRLFQYLQNHGFAPTEANVRVSLTHTYSADDSGEGETSCEITELSDAIRTHALRVSIAEDRGDRNADKMKAPAASGSYRFFLMSTADRVDTVEEDYEPGGYTGNEGRNSVMEMKYYGRAFLLENNISDDE